MRIENDQLPDFSSLSFGMVFSCDVLSIIGPIEDQSLINLGVVSVPKRLKFFFCKSGAIRPNMLEMFK